MLTTALVAGVSVQPPLAGTARAQALQPVVDVCTGISLEPSAVTDIVGDVAVPTATAVESLYDALLGVTVLGSPLITLADVNLNAAATLDAYANGDPISLRIADTSGNLLDTSASDCNLTADGYTLNEPAGLSIGGNQITGLGSGLVASAGELDAIAFGNNASTDVGAAGAVAIGTDASVTVANGVALGSGSVADRAALTGYSAPGLAGTYTSVGSVSVGSAGNLRQITNVAPGSEATDAATVGQVQGALDAIDTLADIAVQYDDVSRASVTLGGGAGGTTLSNLSAGTVSAISTDAVNGSQLFATNQNVDANTTAVAALQTDVATNSSDISALQDSAVQYDDASRTSVTLAGGAGGTTLANVAGGDLSATSTEAVNGSQLFATNQSVAGNTSAITTIQGDVAGNSSDIAALQGSAVQYDDASRTSVTLAGGAGGTTLTNVSPGTLTAISTDAVNGSQLFATNQQVDANTAAIQANTDAISALNDSGSGNSLAVLYDDATRTSLTLDGAGGTTIGNVADGDVSAGSAEAVNGSQLFATNQQVASNSDDIASLDGRVTVNEGAIVNLGDRVTTNEGDITNLDARVTVNETDIANIDGRVTQNSTAITEVREQVANVPVRFVSDADASTPSNTPTNTASFVGAAANPVRVTNVGPGSIAAGSTDAVNGAQLLATNQAVAQNRTDIDQNSADIANINNNLAGSTVVAVQYSDPDNPTQSNGGTLTNDVALVGADAAAPVALHNVADGSLPNDAVNMAQLQSGLSAAVTESRAYTDTQFSALRDELADISFDLEDARKDAFAGTASAMAVASIPQTMTAGRSMFGGGVAHYRGQTAFALGVSTTFRDGDGVVKAGATLDTRGRGGFSAGAGIGF